MRARFCAGACILQQIAENPCSPTTQLLKQVHLCGSFTRWVETVPMAPVDNAPGIFAVVVHLPPG